VHFKKIISTSHSTLKAYIEIPLLERNIAPRQIPEPNTGEKNEHSCFASQCLPMIVYKNKTCGM
jgi:hypothetical protein